MQSTRSEKLDLRLTPEAKRTLNIAATAAGRSVSEFVLESALARAAGHCPTISVLNWTRSAGRRFSLRWMHRLGLCLA